MKFRIKEVQDPAHGVFHTFYPQILQSSIPEGMVLNKNLAVDMEGLPLDSTSTCDLEVWCSIGTGFPTKEECVKVIEDCRAYPKERRVSYYDIELVEAFHNGNPINFNIVKRHHCHQTKH